MKRNKISTILIYTASLVFIAFTMNCCSENKSEDLKNTSAENGTSAVADSSKNTSQNTNYDVSNSVNCTEDESKNEDGGDPIITKTCLFRSFKSVAKGYPDFKGRYSYEYTLTKKNEKETYTEIKNSMLFNDKKNELLSLINSKIAKEYSSLAKNPDTKDCFSGNTFVPFNFDQMGITFSDNVMNFEVSFGLPGACMSVDGSIVSIELSEIQQYLNE